MSILFIGTRAQDFIGPISERTPYYIGSATYTDYELQIMASTNTTQTVQWRNKKDAVNEEFWVHFMADINGRASTLLDGYGFTIYDSAGKVLFRVGGADSASIGSLYGASGGTPVTQATCPEWIEGFNGTVDYRLVVGAATISLTCYIGMQEQYTLTIANTNMVGVGTVEWSMNDFASSQCYFSEAIMTMGESTLGWRAGDLVASGNGADQEWTGDYNSLLTLMDGNMLNTGVAGARSSFTPAAYSGTGNTIRAVQVNYFGAHSTTSGPQSITPYLKIADVNYDGDETTGPLGRYASIWDVNPATGAGWTNTDLANFEFGFLSGALAS